MSWPVLAGGALASLVLLAAAVVLILTWQAIDIFGDDEI